jgi:hypothetical protein
MAVINIRKAKRKGARLVLGFGGVSGAGKTKTALLVAWGLAGFNSSKVGFLDTENRRGSLYADALKDDKGVIHEFLIGDLEPPFTPDRYAQAIREFQAAGVEVLVIDSVSHEYEGTGGILEMREPAPGSSAPRDAHAKAEHKKFMNVLLQSDMHIIACIRAREKVKLEKQGNKTVYIPQGVQPICEKNFMFEMTASLMMWNAGQAQECIKMPDELRHILGREQGYISAQDGALLRAWVDGGEQVDQAIERAKSELKLVCEQGMAALQAAWKKLPAAMRKAISATGACPDDLKLSAQEYDKLRSQAADNATAGLDDLNAQVLGTDGTENNQPG